MKDLATIKEELAPVQKLLEQYRLEQLKKTNKGKVLIAIPLVLFVACIAGMAIFYPNYMFVFLIGMIITAVAIVWVYFNAYSKHIDDYRKKFKSTILQKVVESAVPNLAYKPNDYIPQAEFNASGLFDEKAYAGYSGEDYFEGTIDNIPVRFSEVDAKNLSGKNSVSFFNGIFMIVDVKASFEGATFVLPERSNNFLDRFNKQHSNQHGELIILEDQPKFEKHFAIYTNNKDEAKRILQPDVLEGSMEIRQDFNSDLYLSFQDQKGLVYIAVEIGEYRNILEPNINESLENNKVLNRICTELMTCFEIVKNLPINFE